MSCSIVNGSLSSPTSWCAVAISFAIFAIVCNKLKRKSSIKFVKVYSGSINESRPYHIGDWHSLCFAH